MKHQTRNSSNGRFTKPIIIEKTKPVRRIGVTEFVIAGVVFLGLLVLVDMYVVKIF